MGVITKGWFSLNITVPQLKVSWREHSLIIACGLIMNWGKHSQGCCQWFPLTQTRVWMPRWEGPGFLAPARDTFQGITYMLCEASVPSVKYHISEDGGRSEMLSTLTCALSLSHKHTKHTSLYHIPCCWILDIPNAHGGTSNLNG